MNKTLQFLIMGLAMAALLTLVGCSSDEDSQPPPDRGRIINLVFSNPVTIEVNAAAQLALLLHDRESSRGTAVQLVDLASQSVTRTRILDYYDAYDIIFLPDNEACFVGRTQSSREYAVQFIRLPELTDVARVLAGDTTGAHGYLTVDTVGSFVYYAHAGGGARDGILKISLAAKTPVDADDDGVAPFGFDNELVSGLLARPARIAFDHAARKLVIANLDDDYITFIDAAVWGTLSRAAGHTFPVSGTAHLNILAGGLSRVRAEAMTTGDGLYVFAGTSGSTAFLSRFETTSTGPYPPEIPAGVQWRFRNGELRVHPRADIFSVFILQRDSVGVAVGQYSLNNLRQVAGSPHRPRVIPDSSATTIGIDVAADLIYVADRYLPRMEILQIP